MRVVVSQYEGIDVTPALPLAAGCLVATARADPSLATSARFSIALERQDIDRAVDVLDGPDVLGLSLYPWNAAYSLAVAAAARRTYPAALIVAGGPAVPRRPDRARAFLDQHPALDLLVFSEGELTFRELLRTRVASGDLRSIPGIAVRDEGGHVFTAPPRRVHDFTDTASPFLDGTFDELIARHGDRFTMALCETNRGCPFSCTFCDWSLTKHVVEMPIERVHAELEWIAGHGFRHIMMADANFGIRRRDAEIARYLAELRARTGAPTSFYFYLTKNDHARNLETIDILQAADIGCWVGLAVQDFDDRVLEAVKRDNIQTGESLELRRICGERGIPTFNELILGLPGQTYDSFTDTVVQAMPALDGHDFVLFLCRMIDNTELGSPESRAEHALETRLCEWKTSSPNWDPIVDERQEVVVGTRDMPLPDWQRAYRFAFFAAAVYNLRLLRVPLHHLARSGADLRAYLEALVAGTLEAPRGSVYANLGAILERYLTSILAAGPFVLPSDDTDAPVYVDDALAAVALHRYDEFLGETEAHTPAALSNDALGEGFRYQSLITPRAGSTEPVERTFAHDWPAYLSTPGAPLTSRPSRIKFVPPVYASVASTATFATTHLSCIRARLETGRVESNASGAPRPRGPIHLPVLPASG